MKLTAILLLTICVVGCNRDDETIVVQKVPKPPPAAPAMPEPVVQHDNQPPTANAGPTWTLPQGWSQLAGDNSGMRFATIQVSADNPQVQLTVVPLPAAASDLLSNVNRWEGQLNLPTSKVEDLPKVVKPITVAGSPANLIDLSNQTDRMLALMLPQADQVWFFKLSGPADVVAAQKSNFDAFVQSIHFGSEQSAQIAAPPQVVASDELTYSLPSGWTKEEPKPMRFVSFQAGNIEVIVTKFQADNVGSYLDNINRWRNQVDLPPVNQDNDQPFQNITVDGAGGKRFDMAGKDKRLIVAWIVRDGQAWFFKMIGPSDALSQQQPAFDAFVASVRFAAPTTNQ